MDESVLLMLSKRHGINLTVIRDTDRISFSQIKSDTSGTTNVTEGPELLDDEEIYPCTLNITNSWVRYLDWMSKFLDKLK
jgi:hypothetical protein